MLRWPISISYWKPNIDIIFIWVFGPHLCILFHFIGTNHVLVLVCITQVCPRALECKRVRKHVVFKEISTTSTMVFRPRPTNQRLWTFHHDHGHLTTVVVVSPRLNIKFLYAFYHNRGDLIKVVVHLCYQSLKLGLIVSFEGKILIFSFFMKFWRQKRVVRVSLATREHGDHNRSRVMYNFFLFYYFYLSFWVS